MVGSLSCAKWVQMARVCLHSECRHTKELAVRIRQSLVERYQVPRKRGNYSMAALYFVEWPHLLPKARNCNNGKLPNLDAGMQIRRQIANQID